MTEFVDRLKRHKKKLIVGLILGILLGLLLIWIVGSIWVPFAEEVDDILVYAPENADFILYSRDFPTLIRGLEDRVFIRQVDQNRNLQRWLNSPKIVETQIIPGLRDAYAKLRELDSMLPFDLKALGDLSGRAVMVAGYEPESKEAPPTFLAVVQPESSMARIAVNALLSPTLSSWFLTDQLPESASIEHFNWGARIDFEVARGAAKEAPARVETVALAVARVEAAVIIGTNVNAVANLVRDLAADGLPIFPLSRFEPGWAWDEADASGINLLIRRSLFEDRVRIVEDYLTPMWGADLAQILVEALPIFAGGDLYLQLDIDAAARVKAAIAVDERRPPGLFSNMREIELSAIDEQLEGIIRKLPHYVFGYGLCGADASELVGFTLVRRSLVDKDQRELLYELLSRLDRFKRFRHEDEEETPDITGPLVDEVAGIFDRNVGFILFKKQREEQVRHSEPGVAIVLPVRDPARLESVIAELDIAAERPFHRFDDGPFTFWQVVRDTFLDDRENNKPAFALIDGHLVVTNWVRLFVDMREVIDRRQAGLPSLDTLELNLSRLPIGSRGFLFLDPEQLYAHMDQAKEGWIADRSAVSEFEKLALRNAARKEWLGLSDPRPPQNAWVQREYERRLNRLEADRSEARIRAEIDRNLDYFRGAFGSLFLALGRRDREFRLDFRLATQENY